MGISRQVSFEASATCSGQPSACMRRRSCKQARKRYHNVAQIVAKDGWPDTIRTFAYPSRNQAHQERCDSRVENDAGMKLRVHSDKAVGPGEKYRTDDKPPAELRVGQMPRFPENTVQQGLIHAPEYQFLCEAGHDQEEGPTLRVQFLAKPQNEEDCRHRQGQEAGDHRRLQPTGPESRRHAN